MNRYYKRLHETEPSYSSDDFTLVGVALLTAPRKTLVLGLNRRPSSRLSRWHRFYSVIRPYSRRCAYKIVSGRSAWPSKDPIKERGGLNLYAFVGNNPISYLDKLGKSGLICDKCKKGDINRVHISNWSLIPVSSQGNPNTVGAAMGALSGSEWAGLVQDVGGIVTGATEAEMIKKISEVAGSYADSRIGDKMTEGWSEKMVDAIGKIQHLYKVREGVYIDVQVSWQLCEYTESPSWLGPNAGFLGTRHLDWRNHSYWYRNEDAGNSGITGKGFSYDDVKGISAALIPSITAALQNTDYENPPPSN